MKNRQKGFSTVELLLSLIVVVLIAGVGWYVYQSTKKTEDSLSNAESSSNSTTQKSEKVTPEIPADWKTYENKELGIKYAYPKLWENASKPDIVDAGSYTKMLVLTPFTVKYEVSSKSWEYSEPVDGNTTYEPEKLSSDSSKEVYFIGGADADCVNGDIIIIAKSKAVSFSVPVACENTEKQTLKYSIAQKDEDIKKFIELLQIK